MPSPRNPKEVKQFLELVGYYNKFIPCFADVARPLTPLAKKLFLLVGQNNVRKHFQFLKEILMKEPIIEVSRPKEILCIIYQC